MHPSTGMGGWEVREEYIAHIRVPESHIILLFFTQTALTGSNMRQKVHKTVLNTTVYLVSKTTIKLQ